MALARLITYFLSSPTPLLLLLLLFLLPPSGCSQLVGGANVDGRNANAIGATPFFWKTSCTVSTSKRTLRFPPKPFVNPLVVTAMTLAFCGCVAIGLFWMLFAYLYLKSLDNQNASIAASSDEDDFNDEYGIMSRRRIRTQNQQAQSSARCAESE